MNSRKVRNYKEKFEEEDEGEEVVEYLEVERVIGCKRVG